MLRERPHNGSMFPTAIFAVLCSLTASLQRAAADWHQWRGPARDGCSMERGLLQEWPAEGPKQLWRSDELGLGYAGLAVVGSEAFTLGLFGAKEFVVCLDVETGKQRWSVEAGPEYKNPFGDGPRSTPTVIGNAVYALTGSGHLVKVPRTGGKVTWKVELVKDLGGAIPEWGYCESPLVVDELVICTPGGADGTLAALDARTGKVRWRSKEVTEGAQYASAILVPHNKGPQIVQLVMNQVFAVDPERGKRLWTAEFPGRTAVIPTPVHSDGVVYVTAGYGVGSAAFRIAADGRSVTPVYRNRVMKNHHGGVVRVGAHIYGHSEGPGWMCQDWQTGEEVWSERGFGKGAIHYADGRLYCLDERTGEVVLVDASPSGWRVHGRFTPSTLSSRRSREGGVWTHPIVAGGRLYVRDQELLYCFDVRR